MLRPTTNPAKVLGRKTKEAQALAETANEVGASRPYQTNDKVARAWIELDAHAAELLDHTKELGVHSGNISELLSRLANAGIVRYAEFTDLRNSGALNNWWGGAKPSVTAMSMSGRFEVFYGTTASSNINDYTSFPNDDEFGWGAAASFSGDGGDRGDPSRRVSGGVADTTSRQKVLILPPGSTLTLSLEIAGAAAAGWITLRPLL